MATKFILVGGYPRKAPDWGKVFCEEVVRGFKPPVKILDCLFARPKEDWDKVFAEDKDFFTNFLPNTQIEVRLADSSKFIEQADWASAIYLRGGSTEPLLKLLKRNQGWEKYLSGKTLAGSSAGAHAITKYHYGLHELKPRKGLGLLPAKVIVHYRSDYNAPNIDWDKAYAELKNYKEDLPLYALREGEFVVIER